MLARFFHNMPWPLSLWVPSYMEDGQGNLHRAYNTTPPQRYVNVLLAQLADNPPHQLTLDSNTPLAPLTDFPLPLPSFTKVTQELKRRSQFEFSTNQGIYTGQTHMTIRLQSTNEMADFTLQVRISTHEKITTIQIQLIPGPPLF